MARRKRQRRKNPATSPYLWYALAGLGAYLLYRKWKGLGDNEAPSPQATADLYDQAIRESVKAFFPVVGQIGWAVSTRDQDLLNRYSPAAETMLTKLGYSPVDIKGARNAWVQTYIPATPAQAHAQQALTVARNISVVAPPAAAAPSPYVSLVKPSGFWKSLVALPSLTPADYTSQPAQQTPTAAFVVAGPPRSGPAAAAPITFPGSQDAPKYEDIPEPILSHAEMDAFKKTIAPIHDPTGLTIDPRYLPWPELPAVSASVAEGPSDAVKQYNANLLALALKGLPGPLSAPASGIYVTPEGGTEPMKWTQPFPVNVTKPAPYVAPPEAAPQTGYGRFNVQPPVDLTKPSQGTVAALSPSPAPTPVQTTGIDFGIERLTNAEANTAIHGHAGAAIPDVGRFNVDGTVAPADPTLALVRPVDKTAELTPEQQQVATQRAAAVAYTAGSTTRPDITKSSEPSTPFAATVFRAIFGETDTDRAARLRKSGIVDMTKVDFKTFDPEAEGITPNQWTAVFAQQKFAQSQAANVRIIPAKVRALADNYQVSITDDSGSLTDNGKALIYLANQQQNPQTQRLEMQPEEYIKSTRAIANLTAQINSCDNTAATLGFKQTALEAANQNAKMLPAWQNIQDQIVDNANQKSKLKDKLTELQKPVAEVQSNAAAEYAQAMQQAVAQAIQPPQVSEAEAIARAEQPEAERIKADWAKQRAAEDMAAQGIRAASRELTVTGDVSFEQALKTVAANQSAYAAVEAEAERQSQQSRQKLQQQIEAGKAGQTAFWRSYRPPAAPTQVAAALRGRVTGLTVYGKVAPQPPIAIVREELVTSYNAPSSSESSGSSES